jgi:hypothetical protein
MSRENETSQEPWEEPGEEDSYEVDPRFRQRPRLPRDRYDDRPVQPRQRPRQGGDSRETSRDRAYPYNRRPKRRPDPSRANEPRQVYDANGRSRQGQGTRPPGASSDKTTGPPRERPRQTRGEAYARQRPRRPIYTRDEEDYDMYARPSQRKRPLVDPEVEEYDRQAFRPARGRRRTWSTLLIGCIGGIITVLLILGIIAFVFFRSSPFSLGTIGKTSFTKQVQQSLPISATTRQLQVHNRVGNVSIMVDSTATQATLSAIEKVQASNSSDAAKEFGRIAVNVKTGSDPSILTVNAAVPDASGGLLAGPGDSVDMTIVLPLSAVNSNPTSPLTLSAAISAAGDIAVQNFNGLLTLTDNVGNISVKHGLLTEGSCIQTNNGNVAFDGSLGIGTSADSGLIPCTTNTTQNTHPWFSIKSGTGTIDVTLSAATTNVILDANTNNGKISGSDFGLNIQQNSDGSASYDGPLIAGTSPTAELVLGVSTGNITLHKGA